MIEPKGTVPRDINNHGVALFCLQCKLKNNENTVALFVHEGQSVCENHIFKDIPTLPRTCDDTTTTVNVSRVFKSDFSGNIGKDVTDEYFGKQGVDKVVAK